MNDFYTLDAHHMHVITQSTLDPHVSSYVASQIKGMKLTAELCIASIKRPQPI